MTIIHLDVKTVVEQAQKIVQLERDNTALNQICDRWEANDRMNQKTIRDQEQTISQLRANVERLRVARDAAKEEAIENANEILELQTLAPIGSLEWAISQMREGKKVTRSSWLGVYLMVDSNKNFVTSANWNVFDISWLRDDWQLYQELPAKVELKVGLSDTEKLSKILEILND